MVTDAKALYDPYHREGVVGGSLTDKRTGLEVRVLKERLEALGGSFKWISSERQFADGLTKDTPGVRQLLADRLRYAKIKFTWDPMYLAAKKKTAEDRQLSRNEFAKTKNQVKDDDETYDPKLPAVQEDDMDTKEEPNETAEAYVSGHFTYVDLSQMIDEDENDGYLYVPKTEDMIKDTVKEPCTVLYDLDTKDIVKYDMTKILDTFKGLTMMMMMLYWMLTLPGAKAAHRSEDLQLNEDSNLLEYFWYGDFSKMIYAKYDPYLWLTLMLAGVLVSFIVGHVYGWAAGSARIIFLRHVRGDRLQRELDQLQQQHQQLTEERDTLTDLLREERQRHQREKQRLTNRIGQLNQNLATQEDNFWYKSEQVTNLQNEQNKLQDDLSECRGVLHVCRDALRRANSELSRHWHLHHENRDIYVGAGSHVYHEHEDCGSLADFDGNYATMRPCALCATFEVTPFIEVPNPGGETLEQDLYSAIDYCDEALVPTSNQWHLWVTMARVSCSPSNMMSPVIYGCVAISSTQEGGHSLCLTAFGLALKRALLLARLTSCATHCFRTNHFIGGFSCVCFPFSKLISQNVERNSKPQNWIVSSLSVCVFSVFEKVLYNALYCCGRTCWSLAFVLPGPFRRHRAAFSVDLHWPAAHRLCGPKLRMDFSTSVRWRVVGRYSRIKHDQQWI